jgi:Ca2+-transporting ATPase
MPKQSYQTADDEDGGEVHMPEPTQSPRVHVIEVGSAPERSTVDAVPVVTGDQGEYPIDMPALIETIERRDTEALRKRFGGVEGFARLVRTDQQTGVYSSSLAQRRLELGENKLSESEPVSFLALLAEAFSDRVIQILAVASLISIVFGLFLPNPHTHEVERSTGWIEGTAIIISILVVTLTGSIQNYNKAKKFEEMERQQSVKNVSVIRDGKEITIESTELVVGDIMILETGAEMMCDGLLVQGSDLRTNESPITGEPDLIEKSVDKDVFVVSGTSIEEGTGVILVCAVGMNSFQGQMKKALMGGGGEGDEEGGGANDETPLQEHLEKLGDNIGKFGLAGAMALLLALCLKEIIQCSTDAKEWNASSFLGFVIIAITLIAVAIPEGLPLAVTISLAFSMQAMMKDNCMVRVLASCETMGAATAVCSDKTGTLTKNEMTVVQALIAEEEFVFENYGVIPRNEHVRVFTRSTIARSTKLARSLLDRFVTFSLSANSTAREQTQEDGTMVWVGNKTEVGILGLVKDFQYDYLAVRTKLANDHSLYKQYPFSSAKKRMTTMVKGEVDGKVNVYIKGASESILAACDRYVDSEGHINLLTDTKRAEFDRIIVDMANQGNRTIGIGYEEAVMDRFPDDEPEQMLFAFVGVLGIQDPIRAEVPDAVTRCGTAHLSVRMVTGDNINTAIAISKKARLYSEEEGHVAMTGPDFREMFRTDKAKLIELLPRLRVLARSSPNDKYILVGMLQDEFGEVVGVTGDGTNDAPALKLADVGFAMNAGTDIAKGAADMVLLDDNFATVVTAIKWGRAVNDNIRKFLQFQLAINFAGVGLTIVGSLASQTSKEPLAAVQLLWLNLIMDTLAALSLATELPEEASLARLPVYKQAPLISNKMRTFIGVHGLYQLVLILLLLFLGHKWFDTRETARSCIEVGGIYTNDKNTLEDGLCQQGRVHSTLLFNTFIWFQIFNVFNARKVHAELNCFEGIFGRSRVLLAVFGIIVGLQIIAVEVGSNAIKTTGLGWKHWIICVGLGASELLVGFIIRLIPVVNHVPTREQIIAHHHEERKKQEEEAAEKAKKKAEKDKKAAGKAPSAQMSPAEAKV